MKYDHDFDSNDDFNDFIQLILIYFNRVKTSIDEKSLNIKKALIDFHAKKFQIAFDLKMKNHEKMNTYVRVKKFAFFRKMKILSFKMIFKIKRDLLNNILKYKIR